MDLRDGRPHVPGWVRTGFRQVMGLGPAGTDEGSLPPTSVPCGLRKEPCIEYMRRGLSVGYAPAHPCWWRGGDGVDLLRPPPPAETAGLHPHGPYPVLADIHRHVESHPPASHSSSHRRPGEQAVSCVRPVWPCHGWRPLRGRPGMATGNLRGMGAGEKDLVKCPRPKCRGRLAAHESSLPEAKTAAEETSLSHLNRRTGPARAPGAVGSGLGAPTRAVPQIDSHAQAIPALLAPNRTGLRRLTHRS